MCEPKAEGKLVLTMPRRSHQSDEFQFILHKVIISLITRRNVKPRLAMRLDLRYIDLGI